MPSACWATGLGKSLSLNSALTTENHLPSQHPHEVSDLVIDLCGVFDEAGDFHAEEFTVTLAEAGEGDFGGVEGQAHASGVVFRRAFAFGGIKKQGLEDLKSGELSRLGGIGFEPFHGIGQDSVRPFALIGAVGSGGVDEQVSRVFDGDVLPIFATPFLGGFAAVFIEHEVLQHRHQPGAEAPATGVHAGVQFPTQQVLEEGLCEVLRVLMSLTRAAHPGVERLPISATEALQS